MAIYNGGSGRDLYTGGDENDSIYGNGGDDKLGGGRGNDLVVGGAGKDVLNGDEGDDVLFSGLQDPDFLYGGISFDIGSEVDRMTGGAGDDAIYAGAGDFVDGGGSEYTGDELYISFQGALAGVNADFRPLQQGKSVTIAGGTIKNIEHIGYLEGSEFDDTLIPIDTYYSSGSQVYGRGGNDHLIADYYNEGLWGGDGDDVLDATGTQYGPSVYGEAGNDIITMRSGLGDTAYGGAGDDTISAGGETHGGDGDDIITMGFTYYAATVTGDAGDDRISAASSGNVISGGDGADTLVGAAGADTLVAGTFREFSHDGLEDAGAERDSLSGGGGDDRLYAGYGDSVAGGAGKDSLWLSVLGADKGVRLSTGEITSAEGARIGGGLVTGIETLRQLTASAFADRIALTSTNNVTVYAASGGDTFITGTTSATLFGEDGNDLLVSGAAADRFDGGAGTDTVDYSGARKALSFALGDGTTTAGTGDTLISVENVIGTDRADELVGNSAQNRFAGGQGQDSLSGAGGDDVLVGEEGADTLAGGDGADSLLGGTGKDLLTGGSGRDAFQFTQASIAQTLAEADVVTDFSQIERDRLSLSQVDGDSSSAQIDAFVFVGTAAFSGEAGELRYERIGRNTIVSADTDGDQIADLFVRLNGRVALEVDDFIFAKVAESAPSASYPHDLGAKWALDTSELHALGVHVMLV